MNINPTSTETVRSLLTQTTNIIIAIIPHRMWQGSRGDPVDDGAAAASAAPGTRGARSGARLPLARVPESHVEERREGLLLRRAQELQAGGLCDPLRRFIL